MYLMSMFYIVQVVSSLKCPNFDPLTVTVVESESTLMACEGVSVNGNMWFANGQLLYSKQFALGEITRGIKLLENHSLLIEKATPEYEGIYCCERNFTAVVQYNLTTQVVPTLSLFLNHYTFEESTNTLDLLTDESEVLEIRCSASGSRPVAKLTWLINGVVADSSWVHNEIQRANPDVSHTSDSESTLRFPPSEEQVNVSCRHFGVKLATRNLTLNIQYNERARIFLIGFGFNTMSVAVIIIVIVILVLLLIGLGYFICHRMKDSGRRSSFSYSDRGGSTLGRRATLFGRRGSFTGAIQRIHLGDTKRRSIAPNKKRSPKDVTLITKLRGDGIITTWTAKAVSTPSNDPQFVARTVTDSAQMIDLYNFQSAAAYLSSLDKNMNVVNFLGAAVDNVPYYLYQEYVQCGSLRDYLTTNYRQERASSCNLFDAKQRRNLGSRDSSSLLIAFAKRIANGMAFLESKKYRHPALSARKVLLTPAGNCKLYDFWPKRLSPHRVKQILSKKPQPVAWLAPETLYMDEHTEKSDTWSFAVVLWEIFSLGEIPYVGKTVQEIETAVRANENLNQPLSCPGGWYELMLSCWDRRPKRRPSFQQIKDEIITSITGTGDDRLNVEDEEGNYITISPF